MQKAVFKGNEFKKGDEKVFLQLYKNFGEEENENEVQEIEEYTGPTADELRREAEEFKKQWEIEKKTLLDNTEAQAEQIIKNAEEAASAEVKKKTDEAALIKQDAQAEAEKIIEEAKAKAEEILAKAEADGQEKQKEAFNEGFEEGKKAGYEEGFKEAQRLIDMLHEIINTAIARRQEILEETEQQIVDMVILVSRKVIKVLSEQQVDVVKNNVLQALRKVKGKVNVTVRVNMQDVKLTTEHAKEFLDAVQNIENIKVVEDSSVDIGGCIIDTDFGSIDARISSQLAELEQKILEISPIKSKSKTVQ